MEEHDDNDWQDVVITSSCGMWVKSPGDTSPLGGGADVTRTSWGVTEPSVYVLIIGKPA